MPKELKNKAKEIPATIQIGKNGISDASIEEIKKQLKKRKLVKIKLLRSFHEEVERSKHEIAEELAEKTKSELIMRKGFVIVLYKA